MNLSDIQIIQGLIDGHIVCRPLRPENIRLASIDLTLGEWFWRCDANPSGVFNPYDEDEIKRYFVGPFQAKPYIDVYRKIGKAGWPLPGNVRQRIGGGDKIPTFENIPEEWPVIVLRPFERILAHCHEFVGVHPPGTTRMHARSSTGRVGLTVCKCAGLGDPGYINRWTMEMSNDNEEAIIIPVGERIAQLVFEGTGATREHYGTEKLYESKYQNYETIDEVIDNWNAESMLPRNYKDKRVSLLDTSAETYLNAIAQMKHKEEQDQWKLIRDAHIKGSKTVL
jgi:dCTP deaminase